MTARIKEKISRRKIRRVYDEDLLQQCMQKVERHEKTIYGASKAYGIPSSTIRFRLGPKWTKKTKKGHPTYLSEEEERKIIDWLHTMEKKGFPVVKETLRLKIKAYLDKASKPNPFKNGSPGRKWFDAFLERHKSEITLRTPEGVSAASANVSEADIRGWFSKIREYFVQNDLGGVLLEPSRVYNGDETSFFLNPKTKAVLATPGNRNVYEVEHASPHSNITVMFTFGADGSMVPPDVILPVKRFKPEVLRTFPSNWGVGKSPKGWMDVVNFMLYIRNVFYPFLVKKGVTFPVVLFIDGHSSHMAAEVADLCLDLGIILVALYPNTTRITQPADVSIFKPLKDAWKAAVVEWRSENEGEIISLANFATVLKKAIKQGIKTDSIINGFRRCGLFPFNANSVDYSKCIAHGVPDTNQSSEDTSRLPASSAVTATESLVPGATTSSRSFDSFAVTQSNRNPQEKHTTPMYVKNAVLIPCDALKQALNDIGQHLLNKLRSDSVDLNDDETKIKLLYDRLLKPFDTQLNVNNTRQEQSDLVSNSALVEGEVHEDDSDEGQFYGFEDSQTDVVESNNFTDCPVITNSTHKISAEKPQNVLNDITNNPKQIPNLQRQVSISEVLQTPPTPKRSGKHRSYKRKYHPVLTAQERLQEIQMIEDEKLALIQEKQRKAEKRKQEKEEAENLKKIKAELRVQKKEAVLRKKTERELYRKTTKEKAEQMKREKKGLLEALKLMNPEPDDGMND